MEMVKLINFGMMVLFFVCYAYQIFYIFPALFKKEKPKPGGRFHRFAILIAARNEERVIGDLIDSLKRQNYPADRIHIYVVADNCSDKTAETARAHGAEVWERFNPMQTGKGHALHDLLERVPDRYDAYLVFDADNVAASNFVREMNKSFCAGYDVITSYRNAKNYGDNWISSGYGLWFLREAQYLNRPRVRLGVSCGVSGTGFLFSDRIRRRFGGWNFFLLTEDIEFTAHCITNRIKIGYCETAVFYDEQPTDFRQSVRQRMRWVQGYLQVLRRYGMRLLKGCLHGSFSCFDMLMNIAPAAILTWVCILLNLLSIILCGLNGMNPEAVLLSAVQSLLNLYLTLFCLGLLTTVSEWRRIPGMAVQKVRAVFTFPLFMFTYLPVSVAALLRKPEWKPILHSKRPNPAVLAALVDEKIP